MQKEIVIPKVNKYEYNNVIQQNYGLGWEDVSQYEATSKGQSIEKTEVTLTSKATGNRIKRMVSLCSQDASEYHLTGYPTRVIFRKTKIVTQYKLNNMKKETKQLIAIILLCISFCFAGEGKAQNAKVNSDGNYSAIQKNTVAREVPTPTGKTFTDAKGNIYPVYESEKGKLFYVRVAKESGREYKCYLKL